MYFANYLVMPLRNAIFLFWKTCSQIAVILHLLIKKPLFFLMYTNQNVFEFRSSYLNA